MDIYRIRTAIRACAIATSLLASGLVAAVPEPATEGGGYAVEARWNVGGDGKWDYLVVDRPHHRLFVARATRVQVLDLDTGKLVGEIANTAGVHGIALAPELKRGFTSNGKANSVTVFDLDTLAPITEIKISGQNPDAIVYDGKSRRVYTFNGQSKNVTVIDPATATEVATIPVSGRPEFAVSDGEGHIFVNIEDKNAIAVIDVVRGVVQATWPLAPCEEPTGIALDAAHHRLFSVCHSQRLIVSDSKSGKHVADLPIGAHVDAVEFDPATSLVFSSNGDSANVTVVAEVTADEFVVRGSLPTAAGAKTMALDRETHRLYVPAMTPSGFQIIVAAPH